MELTDYIKQHGIDACAARWGVNRWTVRSWRFGERKPRPEVANRIVMLTGGEVTLAGIYAAHKDNAA